MTKFSVWGLAFLAMAFLGGRQTTPQSASATQQVAMVEQCVEGVVSKAPKFCFPLSPKWVGKCENGSCLFGHADYANTPSGISILQLRVYNKSLRKSFEQKAEEIADGIFGASMKNLVENGRSGEPCLSLSENRQSPTRRAIPSGEFTRMFNETGPHLDWQDIQTVNVTTCNSNKGKLSGKIVLHIFYSEKIPQWMFVVSASVYETEPELGVYERGGPIYRGLLTSIGK